MSASFKHGTYSAYAEHGCRCDRCRDYQNDRNRRNRADRLATGRLAHGTLSAWDAGCRCPECATVKRDANAKYYARAKRSAS